MTTQAGPSERGTGYGNAGVPATGHGGPPPSPGAPDPDTRPGPDTPAGPDAPNDSRTPHDGEARYDGDELPTVPPSASRGRAGLRWATPERLLGRDRGGPGVTGAGTGDAPRPSWPAGGLLQPGQRLAVPPRRLSTRSLSAFPNGRPPAQGRPARPAGDEAARRGVVTTSPVEGLTWSPTEPVTLVQDEPAPDEASGAPARARPGRGVWVLALIVLVLVVTTVAVVVRVSSLRAGRTVSTTTPPAGGAPQVFFEGLLASTAGAQRRAATALSTACRVAAPGVGPRQSGATQLSNAEATDRSVLVSLGARRGFLAALPGGAALAADLGQLAGESAQADADYRAWLLDLEATGCYGAPTNDIHYLEASQASLAASAAQRHLADGWAPLARRAGLPVWPSART